MKNAAGVIKIKKKRVFREEIGEGIGKGWEFCGEIKENARKNNGENRKIMGEMDIFGKIQSEVMSRWIEQKNCVQVI